MGPTKDGRLLEAMSDTLNIIFFSLAQLFTHPSVVELGERLRVSTDARSDARDLPAPLAFAPRAFRFPEG